MHDESDAAGRLAAIRRRIEAAARAAGREADAVTLVAISKTFGPEAIAPLLDAGQGVFGENRVQEAAGKWPALKAGFEGVELHLVGALQSNKARDAVALFDAIHSLDRDSLASALAKEIGRQGRAPTLFVQVNIGDEAQKAGVSPREAAAFVRRCREAHGLAIRGLMCIPPVDTPARPHFDRLAELASELELPLLSMGMSGDFEEAVAAGATHVRIGSALFGSR